MSNKDLVMHKLKGVHKYQDLDQSFDNYGRVIKNQKCTVCGYLNKVVTSREDFYGNASASWYNAVASTQPWGSSFSNASNLTVSGMGGGGVNGINGNMYGGGGGAGGLIHFAGNVPLVVGANPPNTNVTVKKEKKWSFSNIFGK